MDRQASQLKKGTKRGKVADDRSTGGGGEKLFGVTDWSDLGEIFVPSVESVKMCKRRVERVGRVTLLFATRPNQNLYSIVFCKCK